MRIVKLLVGGLVVGGLMASTYLKDEDGNALLRLSNWQVPEFKFPDITLPKFFNSGEKNKTLSPQPGSVIYQWRDSRGNLQFSGDPPAAGVEYTVRTYDSNINVIQSVNTETKQSQAKDEAESEATSGQTEGIANAYSPEGIEKIFEDVNNIEKLLNQQFKNQETVDGQ